MNPFLMLLIWLSGDELKCFTTEADIIETSPLTSRANQWTSFYMISASVMKELNIKIRAENKANIAAFLESILN